MEQRRGFTLIELAIVLVIIGLLIGLGVGLIGPLTKRAKVIESREIVDAAVFSLISYAAGNKCLSDNLTQANVRSTNDAWGSPLFLRVAPELYGGNCNPFSGNICNRKTTSLIVKLCEDTACTNYQTVSNVAFVVASKGSNYNLQIANKTNEVWVYIAGLNVDSYSGTYGGIIDPNRIEEFDDIVKWVTLDELRAKMGCLMQIRIVNNELPYGFEGGSYIATVYAEGGVSFPSGGKYKWCREGNLPSGLIANPSPSSTDCLNLQEDQWGQADNLVISGTPAKGTAGTYHLTFFVRDNNDPTGPNDNIAKRTLVLTINPATFTTPPSLSCAYCGMYDTKGECESKCTGPRKCIQDYCGSLLCWKCSD